MDEKNHETNMFDSWAEKDNHFYKQITDFKKKGLNVSSFELVDSDLSVRNLLRLLQNLSKTTISI